MLKGQDIIGKKVLSRLDGQRLDSVRDIIISKDHTRIVALILDEGGLFSPATAVAIENVVSFGKDAVVITDSKTVTRVDHFPAVKEILDERETLIGKHVFTESGQQMGKVEDVYFEETTGAITALEVAGKIMPTERSASVQLPVGDVVSIGPDAVIINLAAIPKLEAQVVGGGEKADASDAVPQDAPPAQGYEPAESLQVGSSVPDLTGASSPPMATDFQPGAPSMPSTAPLPPMPGDADGQAYGAGDAGDLPSSTGRVNDPTSSGQGQG
jgi:uncharacterized protein YrrD